MKKIFELKEEQIEIIREVMKQHPECNTEAAAIRYIIESYNYEKVKQNEFRKNWSD